MREKSIKSFIYTKTFCFDFERRKILGLTLMFILRKELFEDFLKLTGTYFNEELFSVSI